MRTHIPALDTATLAWTPGMLPGSFRKRLNDDPDTGGITGMTRFEEGASTPPSRPHFHHLDEEILVLGGEMTFDHRTWLPRAGYCYHPVGTVHGFHSGMRGSVDFMFRSAGGAEFKLNYIEGEPEKREWYQAFGPPPSRAPAYIADWTDMGETLGRDGVYRTLLSRDSETGVGSMYLRFPAGWSGTATAAAPQFYREMFVLEGEATTLDNDRLGKDYYAFIPPDVPHSFKASDTGSLIFVSFGGGAVD